MLQESTSSHNLPHATSFGGSGGVDKYFDHQLLSPHLQGCYSKSTDIASPVPAAAAAAAVISPTHSINTPQPKKKISPEGSNVKSAAAKQQYQQQRSVGGGSSSGSKSISSQSSHHDLDYAGGSLVNFVFGSFLLNRGTVNELCATLMLIVCLDLFFHFT